ncbi:SMP-30/gluconolactonase/LRE family protein [Roseibium limicola]|uniref:SMP-30/gluconolactonase/LRE family protein n=1 Tax=Roseibium limicola TaxID=2816037 RepID=A0A939ERS2_9HYPH|nr:SMP-30/gluconolactonase/LRE family protein [Roseibium limicola]MBO0347367.1 SMP-30/gluconolactonase/LRE family protein [Roseibium limicola]
MADLYDDRACFLGEGPLWHPERKQLFWFDIIGKKLLSQKDGAALEWDMAEHASAAAVVDADRLLIASETCFSLFDIATGKREPYMPLEADNPVTRSNDGRVDPFGGFWIGTMGKSAEQSAGSYWRLYKGELRKLWGGVSIPNATCFTPDGSHAFLSDTALGLIWRQALDGDGWPLGEREVFLDLKKEGLNPDGAVIDTEGRFWNAQWGASRLAAYSMDGALLETIDMPTAHITCPAFGGDNLMSLFATSAQEGLSADELTAQPHAGKTFVTSPGIKGLAETAIKL